MTNQPIALQPEFIETLLNQAHYIEDAEYIALKQYNKFKHKKISLDELFDWANQIDTTIQWVNEQTKSNIRISYTDLINEFLTDDQVI